MCDSNDSFAQPHSYQECKHLARIGSAGRVGRQAPNRQFCVREASKTLRLVAALMKPFLWIARRHRAQQEYRGLLLDSETLEDIGAPAWMLDDREELLIQRYMDSWVSGWR